MRLSHDEVREILPDYLKDTLSEVMRKEIEAHLKDCDGCVSELSFLKEIVQVDVPDPGDLFWQNLPRRVRMTVKKERTRRFSLKSILFRPFPVAATVAVLVLLVSMFIYKREVSAPDPLFKDPFEVSLLEYGDINNIAGKEIALITAQLADNELALLPVNSIEYSYHGEVASLSSIEVERIYEELMKAQGTGS